MLYYIDESGNTGDNLVDPNQKYFGIGAFGIKKEGLKEFEANISESLKNIPTATNSDLKTKKTIGTKFEPELIKVLEACLKKDTDIIAYLLEKRFMICGMIVEDFFDPYYNNFVTNYWTHPVEIKKELANFFYDMLSEETIVLCGKAFTKGDENQLSTCYSLIQTEIQGSSFKFDVSAVLRGVESKIPEISRAIQNLELENREGTIIKRSTQKSPNYTTYYTLINKIENDLRSMDEKAELIFDSSKQFDIAYKHLFDLYKNAKNKIINTRAGNIYFGYERITEFSVGKSEDHLGIQMADLISTTFVHIIKIIDEEKSVLTEYEKMCTVLLIQLLLLRKADLIMSDRLIQKIGNKIKEMTAELRNQ